MVSRILGAAAVCLLAMSGQFGYTADAAHVGSFHARRTAEATTAVSPTTAAAATTTTSASSASGSSSAITNPERNNSSPTMQVTGQGSTDITTDLLRVDMTISQNLNCKNKPLDECNASSLQQDVNKKLQSVMNLQKELDGVESMQTQGLDLSLKYDYVNGTQVFKGYRSSVQLVAIVNNDVVGEFLDELLTRGVKSIDDTRYYLTDKQRKDAQKECLALATENALQQADAILGALGKTRLDVKTVDIPYNENPFIDTQVTPGTLLSNSSSPVTNGLLTVSYQVKMRIQY